MPFRIYNIMQNTVLMAVPLFILMGIVLQKTSWPNSCWNPWHGCSVHARRLAVSTILVGGLLAASTGVVGASVVAMGVISLPVMLKYGYSRQLSCGVICGAGTLGQIIPPSIILIILGDVMGLAVGDLFQAALIPVWPWSACTSLCAGARPPATGYRTVRYRSKWMPAAPGDSISMPCAPWYRR